MYIHLHTYCMSTCTYEIVKYQLLTVYFPQILTFSFIDSEEREREGEGDREGEKGREAGREEEREREKHSKLISMHACVYSSHLT